MQKLVINGGHALKGSIEISGAKNAALPLLACSLLSDEPLTLSNVPGLADIKTMRSLLKQHGVAISETTPPASGGGRGGELPSEQSIDGSVSEAMPPPNPPRKRGGDIVPSQTETEKNTTELSLTLNGANVHNLTAPYDLVRTMRASILVLGPLLARHGAAKVSLPGGCAIGTRPVDMHLSALEKMGAAIELVDGYVHAHVDGRLRGAVIDFDKVSVGATENTLMAASLAKGTTVINNAAREPEVCDLAECLVAMGATIDGIGTSRITIEGADHLHKASHRVVTDRIEAGSFACAAAITRGEVELIGAKAEHMGSVLDVFAKAGVMVSTTENGLHINGKGGLRAVDIVTQPYPGFPTDMQAQFMAMLSLAEGDSTIAETIFENRFMHVSELLRMGANINIQGNSATVTGVSRLKGAEVMATDLRASLSLVIAALAAEGESTVHRLYHLDRGYEKLVRKLAGVGADIQRVDVEAPVDEKVVALREVV